jgi:acyl-CoA thioester hydrolase
MALYDDAEFGLNRCYGMDEEYFRSGRGLLFDLTHHVRYLNEVAIGSSVRVVGRTIGVAKSGRRVHFKLYMVSYEGLGEEVRYTAVASTLECLQAHIDADSRRMSEFPPDIRAKVDEHLQKSQALPFTAAVCGSIDAR